jgi:hypothetical protein
VVHFHIHQILDLQLTQFQWSTTVTEEHENVHKPIHVLDALPSEWAISRDDAHDRHVPPEVAPARAKHAGLRCLPHGKERRHAPKELVREGVNPYRRRPPPIAPAGNLHMLLRHFVEQKASAGPALRGNKSNESRKVDSSLVLPPNL